MQEEFSIYRIVTNTTQLHDGGAPHAERRHSFFVYHSFSTAFLVSLHTDHSMVCALIHPLLSIRYQFYGLNF